MSSKHWFKIRLAAAFLPLALLVGQTVWPADAAARKVGNKAAARRWFEQGELHYRQGAFRQALAAYKQAQRHLRDPAFIFNIAQCHRQLKEYEKALFFYKLYLDESPRATNRTEVRRRIKEMNRQIELEQRRKGRAGRVSVVTRPAGAAIRVDRFSGPAMAVSPAIVKLLEGERLILVNKPGYRPIHRKVTVQAGKLVLVEITLEPAGDGRPAPRRPTDTVGRPPGTAPRRGTTPVSRAVGPPTPATVKTPGRVTRTWWFWTGVGTAVALTVGAAVGGALALRYHDDYVWSESAEDTSYFNDRAKKAALATDILWPAAVTVGVITLVAALVHHLNRKRAERSAARVAPVCGPTGCGLSVQGTF